MHANMYACGKGDELFIFHSLGFITYLLFIVHSMWFIPPRYMAVRYLSKALRYYPDCPT